MLKRVTSLIVIFLIVASTGSSTAFAAENKTKQSKPKKTVVEVDNIADIKVAKAQSDGPTRMELRRVDRQINRRKFIFQGEQMYGITASYMSLDSENTQLYMLLDNIAGNLTIASVKPYGGYFYRDNRAIGARFGYSTINGTLDAATVDLGEVNELTLDVPYVSYTSRSYSAAVFHRAYAALDPEGHFGLFAEVELSAAFGTSGFGYQVDGVVDRTKSYSTSVNIGFNPGMAVFILHNVCATVSFEFGGLNYTRIDQFDADGVYQGYRESSAMRFRFNMLAINMGINVHF